MTLNRRFIRMSGRTDGITFIEIMIGIAIFGFIVAMLLPVLTGALNKMKLTKAQTNLRFIKMEVENFKMHTGQYPATLQDLVERPSDQKVASRWQGPYLTDDRVLVDGWNNELVYQRTGGQPPYQLYSWGSEGEGSPQDKWINAWTI